MGLSAAGRLVASGPVLPRHSERRRDREEDAAGEEESGLLPRHVSRLADRFEQADELVADRLTERRVAGRGVRLQLAEDLRAVADHAEVRLAHRAQALLGIGAALGGGEQARAD